MALILTILDGERVHRVSAVDVPDASGPGNYAHAAPSCCDLRGMEVLGTGVVGSIRFLDVRIPLGQPGGDVLVEALYAGTTQVAAWEWSAPAAWPQCTIELFGRVSHIRSDGKVLLARLVDAEFDGPPRDVSVRPSGGGPVGEA